MFAKVSDFFMQSAFKALVGTIAHALLEAFILSDSGKGIIAKMLKMIDNTEALTVAHFQAFVEHPDVDSEQFAKIVVAILSGNIHDEIQEGYALAASSKDILALKKHIKSREVQKTFFRYFEIDVLEIEAAWSTLASMLKNRHGVWRREHGDRTFEHLEELGYLQKSSTLSFHNMQHES